MPSVDVVMPLAVQNFFGGRLTGVPPGALGEQREREAPVSQRMGLP